LRFGRQERSCLRTQVLPPVFKGATCVTVSTRLTFGTGLVENRNEGLWVQSRIGAVALLHSGTAVAQWLRFCASNRKVAGSIPDGVMEFFIGIILPIALWPWGRLSL